MTDSNTPSDLLLELVRGQEQAAEALKNQNTRLFGGEGQKGALPYMLEQHENLIKKIDETRVELAAKVESARLELASTVESTRRELATNVEATRKELATNVEGTRKELSTAVESTRSQLAATQLTHDTKIDEQISDLSEKHLALNGKVNKSVGIATGFYGAVTLALGYLGVHHH
jgi:hypothetical protein